MKLSAPIYQLKRRAKLMARDRKIALHTALDRVAHDEGFAGWSLLSARVAAGAAANDMLSRLSDGDLLLLGARPGQGKTLRRMALPSRRAHKKLLSPSIMPELRRTRFLFDDGADYRNRFDNSGSDPHATAVEIASWVRTTRTYE